MALKNHADSEKEMQKALNTIMSTRDLSVPREKEGPHQECEPTLAFEHIIFYIPVKTKIEGGYLSNYLKTPTLNIRKALVENSEKSINEGVSRENKAIRITLLEGKSQKGLNTDLLVVFSGEVIFGDRPGQNLESNRLEAMLPKIIELANKDLSNFGREINLELLAGPSAEDFIKMMWNLKENPVPLFVSATNLRT